MEAPVGGLSGGGFQSPDRSAGGVPGKRFNVNTGKWEDLADPRSGWINGALWDKGTLVPTSSSGQPLSPAMQGLQSMLTGAATNSLSGLQNPSSGSSGSSGSGSSGGGISGGATLPGVELPDQTAATDARYATARDKVGKESRASIDALRGELGATGNLGGGAEVQGVRDVVQSGAGELGQVNRDEAGKQADLSADFAKTRYGGAIAQRGQDVSASEASARLAQEQRLADASLSFQKQQAASSQQLQMLQLALSGLKGLSSGSSYSY